MTLLLSQHRNKYRNFREPPNDHDVRSYSLQTPATSAFVMFAPCVRGRLQLGFESTRKPGGSGQHPTQSWCLKGGQ